MACLCPRTFVGLPLSFSLSLSLSLCVCVSLTVSLFLSVAGVSWGQTCYPGKLSENKRGEPRPQPPHLLAAVDAALCQNKAAQQQGQEQREPQMPVRLISRIPFHIWMLAHVLRRPIIVYSKWRVHGQVNPVLGIYLPTLSHQCSEPKCRWDCHRRPLALVSLSHTDTHTQRERERERQRHTRVSRAFPLPLALLRLPSTLSLLAIRRRLCRLLTRRLAWD